VRIIERRPKFFKQPDGRIDFALLLLAKIVPPSFELIGEFDLPSRGLIMP